MQLRKIKYCTLLFSLFIVYAWGQPTQGDVARYKQIVKDITLLKDISYEYMMQAHFPGKQSDEVKGTIYINNTKKMFVNNCDAFTMLYSTNWLYKADHRGKTLTIVNLAKANKDELKTSIENDVFGNGSLQNFIDSIVLKHGTLMKLTTNEDTVQMEIGFPNWMRVRQVTIVYDWRQKFLLGYLLTLAYQREYSREKIVETMTCKDFKRIDSKKSDYKEEDYFLLDKSGAVKVKKYSKYKLYTKL